LILKQEEKAVPLPPQVLYLGLSGVGDGGAIEKEGA